MASALTFVKVLSANYHVGRAVYLTWIELPFGKCFQLTKVIENLLGVIPIYNMVGGTDHYTCQFRSLFLDKVNGVLIVRHYGEGIFDSIRNPR